MMHLATRRRKRKCNNPYRYAGYRYDGETGLYYLNARYYDATTARFMSEDTYSGQANDPLSLNLYTYCHNEPIMYEDPTGHKEDEITTWIDTKTGKTTYSIDGIVVDRATNKEPVTNVMIDTGKSLVNITPTSGSSS